MNNLDSENGLDHNFKFVRKNFNAVETCIEGYHIEFSKNLSLLIWTRLSKKKKNLVNVGG